MEKIIAKDFRPEKEVKLPLSGISISFYPSVLVGELQETKVGDSDFVNNLNLISKVIKVWNFYEKQEDDKPLPITVENIKRLPATDFEWFINELQKFSAEQKKS